MIELEGKSAIVTGGGRGIGKACCELLAGAGARVALSYRVERPWAELVAQRICENGGEAFALGADVSRPEDAEMIVDETVDRYEELKARYEEGLNTGNPGPTLRDAALVSAIKRIATVVLQRDIWP